MFKKVILVSALALTVTACATVTRGTKQSFTVETDPIGAQVELSTGETCEYTPCTFELPRKNGFTVTVMKDGYETVTSEITSTVSGGGGAAMAGNVLVGGLIGAGIDASSGAMNDLKPNPLVLKLIPLSAEELNEEEYKEEVLEETITEEEVMDEEPSS